MSGRALERLISELFAGTDSGIVVKPALMNGVSCGTPPASPFQSFRKHEQALVGHFHNFVDYRQRADGVQVTRLRRIDPRFALATTTMVLSSPSELIN
jgi:hypothetical protein